MESAEKVRFNLLHLVSDWFRNPQFRGRFMDLQRHDRQITLMRQEYDLNDAEIDIIVGIKKEALVTEISKALTMGNADRPGPWEGVTAAATMGDDTAWGGPGPGWPGTAWVCLESIEPSTVAAGQTVTLVLVGWNLTDKAVLRLRAAEAGTNPIDLQFTLEKPDGNGRCVVTSKVVLPQLRTTWTVELMPENGGPGDTALGSLPDALTTT